jgi:PAS domain-containing protein
MLELRVIKGPQGIENTFSIDSGKSFTLGRSEECQIRLASAGISKKHCVITPISLSRVEVEDLGSSNGTYINGLLIKKHIMQPGDTLSVHNFVLQLAKKAPNVDTSAAVDQLHNTFINPEDVIDASGTRRAETFAEKVDRWFAGNVYPLADNLSAQMDIRLLCIIALAIWTLIVTTLALNPFKDLANERARNESIEVARLYARQMVRLNQRAIIEQRYKDVVSQLDSRRGETPGILDAVIVDTINAQILSPAERLGQAIPRTDTYVQIALTKDVEHVSLEENIKKAYVSVPIKIGTAEGNRTVAAAVVEYSYVDGQFTLTNLVEQIVNSIFYAIVLSGLFLIFIYRWTNGSLLRAAAATEEALKESKTALSLNIQWPALAKVSQEIGYCLTKAIEGGSGEQTASVASSDWAQAAVQNTLGAAAALDENLTVVAWNKQMATIIGIQEAMAIGADISQASRDVAFETAVREMSEESKFQQWQPIARSIEFSGRLYKISVVCGSKSFLFNLDAEEG